ncbi:hypothetical protein [Gloeothece verrucosa]|nr:hypothetical protein [Gloeothece verrucosa]
MLIVKPFSNGNSASDSVAISQLNEAQDSDKTRLVGKWLKDKNGKLYCHWTLE